MGEGYHITPKHRAFARLYLEPGPYQGNWAGACKQAGFLKALARSKTAMRAIEEHANKHGLDIGQKDVRAPDASTPDDLGNTLDPDMALISAMPDDADWEDMAKVARRVMRKSLANKLQLSTAQVAVIKEIIGRAEGRIGQERERTDDSGLVRVVILPVRDTNMGPVIDVGDEEEIDPGDTIPGLTIRQVSFK